MSHPATAPPGLRARPIPLAAAPADAGVRATLRTRGHVMTVDSSARPTGTSATTSTTTSTDATAAQDTAAAPPPPDWLPDVAGEWRTFANWSEQVVLAGVWTALPSTGAEAVAVVAWAAAHGRTARAVGHQHTWSPLVVTPSEDPAGVVLLDTSGLASARFVPQDADGPDRAVFGPGVTVECATAFLQAQPTGTSPGGYSFLNMTAPGALSLGGVLAVGAHGTGVPQPGEPALDGCLSNLLLAVTAVVRDPVTGTWVERTFSRGEDEAAALLVHLGRAILTEVTLAVVPDYYLTVRHTWPAFGEVFAPRPVVGSLAEQVERFGRVEAIWWPFAELTWLKTWERTATPGGGRYVDGPYDYPWADWVPPWLSAGFGDLCRTWPSATPHLVSLCAESARFFTHEEPELSGTARDLLLYVTPSTLRYGMLGYALHVDVDQLQAAASAWVTELDRRIRAEAAQGRYPVNGPSEIRVTTCDDPAPLGVPGACPPLLSATTPTRTATAGTVVLWVDVLTYPGTPGSDAFLADFEAWMRTTWVGHGVDEQALRPEWSKGWGYTAQHGAWTADWLPQAVAAAYPQLGEAARVLAGLDPHRVISNPLHATLGL